MSKKIRVIENGKVKEQNAKPIKKVVLSKKITSTQLNDIIKRKQEE